MLKDKVYNDMPRMQREKESTYSRSPIVAHSPSFQQPVAEAMEQTAYALKQREHYGKK
jgi:hypothetical protein